MVSTRLWSRFGSTVHYRVLGYIVRYFDCGIRCFLDTMKVDIRLLHHALSFVRVACVVLDTCCSASTMLVIHGGSLQCTWTRNEHKAILFRIIVFIPINALQSYFWFMRRQVVQRWSTGTNISLACETFHTRLNVISHPADVMVSKLNSERKGVSSLA